MVSVATASGGYFSTTVTKPSGTLAGVVYSPTKAASLATTYTVSPPGGTWPANSRISCLYVLGGSSYGLDYSPTGSETITVPGARYASTSLAGATSIAFSAFLRSPVPITGFDSSSFIYVQGNETKW